MIERFLGFLSNWKMTLVSMIFLVISAILMVLKIKSPFDFAFLTILISGLPIFYWGFKLFFTKGKMTASLLISLAMIAAICTNEIFAAAEVAFIMALGGILEDLTIDKAKRGITNLLKLVPKTARRIIDGKEEVIPAENVKVHDIIRVFAGEDIPADGIIIEGETSVNEAILTGESATVDKTKGDDVFSGTTNCFGVIDVEVKNEFKDSTIQKLVNLVKEAENKKAPTQRIVDKWASVLIPMAVLFALTVYLLTGEISRAVTILVVFCPCSFVLATPTSIMAGIGHAARNGIIVKTGDALENIGKCDVFAFDKTGTITKGKLSVVNVESFSNINEDEILILSSSAEYKSEHPIGRTIVEYACSKNIEILNTTDFKMFLGKGVYAKIDNKRVFVGNEKFMSDNDIELSGNVKKAINSKRLDGKIVLIVAIDKIAEGLIAMTDTLRETSQDAIKSLEDAETVLLTGDNSLTAEYFARKSGIKTVFSGMLPKEKAEKIKSMQKENKLVAMTGDGVNDAVALKVANTGISMGTFGSDIAIESSDIIITGDDLCKISYLRHLSRAVIKIIKTNITISMCINLISLTLSALAILNPMTGAIVHNVASIIVVSNAAFLYDKKIN